MSNKNKFNIYVFLSTFARNLIEVFIPIILYKFGYNLKEVIFYYLLVNMFSLLFTYKCSKMLNKINYKTFSFVGIFAFAIMQILLNKFCYSIWYIIILAFLFALYRRGYWISRRFYNLNIISEKNISISYTIISIINQLGVIFAAYIGAILLDFVGLTSLTIISITLFCISIIPLYFIDIKTNKNNSSLELTKTIEKIGIRKLYLFGAFELLNVIKFLFPLYLVIYVKNTYQTVGLLSLITSLATMAFAYLYGKKINTNRNYLNLSILLVVITYFLKANTTSYLLILVSFLEGIFFKIYEISINKEFYVLSKEFEYQNYNMAYELSQNLFRTIVVFILLFLSNVQLMIYVTLIFIIIGVLVNASIESEQTLNYNHK